MKNRNLKELNSLKKLTTAGLFHKSFKLPYLTISSTYQNYSKDVFQIMDNIYQELEVDALLSALLDGKEVNFTEKRAALHHRYRDLSKKNSDFDSISASKFLFKNIKEVNQNNSFIFNSVPSIESKKNDKKEAIISEDDLKKFLSDAQKNTDVYISKIDKILEQKKSDIMKV